MKRFATLIVLVLLFAVAIVLGLKNQQMVNVNYLIAQNDVRLSTLFAINFMLGFIVSACFGAFFYFRLTMKNRRLNKVNKKQRKALNQTSETNNDENNNKNSGMKISNIRIRNPMKKTNS